MAEQSFIYPSQSYNLSRPLDPVIADICFEFLFRVKHVGTSVHLIAFAWLNCSKKYFRL